MWGHSSSVLITHSSPGTGSSHGTKDVMATVVGILCTYLENSALSRLHSGDCGPVLGGVPCCLGVALAEDSTLSIK